MSWDHEVQLFPYLEQRNKGYLTITDDRMTRFMITLDEGIQLVNYAFEDMMEAKFM